MGRTQTTQQTGKSWKLVQGVGCLSVIAGVVILGFGIGLAEPGSREATAQVGAAAMGLILAGLPVWLFGRMGAWWFHG